MSNHPATFESTDEATESTTVITPVISLVNVAQHYNPASYPHQATSLDWLQHQLPDGVPMEFFLRWHNTWGRQLPTLRQGDRGAAVMELQQHLNRWGFGLVVDGVFGTRTSAAVTSFQQRRGLKVDGIVGPRTWNELIKPAQTIRLAQLLRLYSPALYPSQNSALEWLQKQVRAVVLTEFAKRWRNQVQ